MSIALDYEYVENEINAATRVLGCEIEGLKILQHWLQREGGKDFTAAIQILCSQRGKVIVSGMGKSGHIGRKIASTLASTGTPSHFVHPAEASHGDLGMITTDDAIIALSWSGQTYELADLVGYSRRFRIPLIAVTAGKDSALSRAADVSLIMPSVAEACPHGLAPTTSTLMQLALGDALAICLLEQRGFTAAQFKVFHPGGRLGAALKRVSELMHAGPNIPLATLGTLMGDALVEISAKGLGCIAVVDDDGLLAGIITDGDLRRHMCNRLPELRVEDVMTAAPRTIKPNTLAATALNIISEAKITSLLVVDSQRPVGVLHLHDLLRAGVA